MAQNEKEQNDYKITYYNAVSSKEVDWLWYPYIPYGKITILQGDPGEGKSTMMIQNIEESKEEKKDGGFDLSGYEIVRAQFFSTRLNPAMTISEGRITFNTACLKKFEDVEYVEILFNSIERCIAVRPCDKDNINAVKWGTIRNGKLRTQKI